ncbi:MAG: dihydropteroate synthase-like protein [Sulfolobales archaeon]
MRILVVTSRLAEQLIKEIVDSIKLRNSDKDLKIDVIASKIPIAALMTSRDLRDLLGALGERIHEYDLIITPGLLIGDIGPVCREYGVKCFKGSRYAGDLPRVIDIVLKGDELSTIRPADEFIDGMAGMENTREILLERAVEAFKLRDLRIPAKPPPILIASEVVVEGDMERDLKNIDRVVNNKCDILIIGTDVTSNKPEYIRDLFRVLYKRLSIPIAIDSLNIEEIEEAVREGASIVMNISRSFEHWIERILSISRDIGFVIVPEDVGSGRASERAEACVREYEYFSRKGLDKIILDPIIPFPLFGSIEAIYSISLVKRSLEKVPLLLGAGNIYELIDSDPVGSISLLAVFGVEVGASIMLVTEESWKSRDATRYARDSSEITARAFIRRSPPIDVGLDLYIAKSKKPPDRIMIPHDRDILVEEKIPPTKLDRKRFFVIQPDYDNKLIEVYIFLGDPEKALYRLRGRDPRSLGRKALRLAKIEDPEHAFYLGLELARAYEALRTGRAYTQDEELRSG